MQIATTLDEVVDETGPLIEIAPRFERGTEWTAQQHMNARGTEPDTEKRRTLRDRLYWTNDSSLYPVEKGKSVIYLGTGDLILDNLAEVVSQLIQNGNYRPAEEVAQAFKRAPTTIRANLDDLGLKKYGDEFSYFVIKPLKGRDGLNPVQVIFAERPYGQAEDFEDNMKMLYDSEIYEIRVKVLNPDYVKQMNVQGPIVRPSWLGEFSSGSGFFADLSVVDFPDVALRGVRRRSVEGAPQITEVLDKRITRALKTEPAFK